MNGCNVLFAVSQIEDCLELNFRYVDYQTLAHLSCSSCVHWISACATRAQRFLSVRESISASTYTKREQKCGHITTKVEWTQTYNERPSYTTIHKGTNMRSNTQKLFKCHNYQSLTLPSPSPAANLFAAK